MPIHYNNQVYKTFNGAVLAVKRVHPNWSVERCKRYIGGIERIQNKNRKRKGKK